MQPFICLCGLFFSEFAVGCTIVECITLYTVLAVLSIRHVAQARQMLQVYACMDVNVYLDVEGVCS